MNKITFKKNKLKKIIFMLKIAFKWGAQGKNDISGILQILQESVLKIELFLRLKIIIIWRECCFRYIPKVY